MGRVEVGMYFRLFDFDDQKPQEVVNAKIVVNEMQDTFAHKMRQIKQQELAEHATSMTLAKGGALAVLREGRTHTRTIIGKRVALGTVAAVTHANGDLLQAASILGVGKETIRQRLVKYVDRKWVERVGPREWKVLPECENGEGDNA